MDADRTTRIVAALAATGPPDPSTYPLRVCAVSSRMLGMTGAGLSLPGGAELGAAWASDELARELEEMQLRLGEGPGLDVLALRRPMLEPDLHRASSRWPFFRPAAVELGARAVFAFPLQVGVIGVGVLTLHRVVAGDLSGEELADALVLTDVVTHRLLDLQSRGDLGWGELDVHGRRAEVHQATGMVSVQLNSSMSEALIRLRAHAFANGTTIYDIAEQVVSRRLRFD